jgi:uncharacterized DUF497 family protein
VKEHISGFDWDAGNRQKCLKHGVSVAEIEALFQHPLAVLPDEKHSIAEQRFKAIGKGKFHRSIFLVFTLRIRNGKTIIRPISARYMHRQEVNHYEKENPDL